MMKKLSGGGLEELHLDHQSVYTLHGGGAGGGGAAASAAARRRRFPASPLAWFRRARDRFVQLRLELSEKVAPGWEKVASKLNYVPDEIALQVRKGILSKIERNKKNFQNGSRAQARSLHVSTFEGALRLRVRSLINRVVPKRALCDQVGCQADILYLVPLVIRNRMKERHCGQIHM